MKRSAKILLTFAALCAAVAFSPARAEFDVIKLKAAIEKSVEADYPKLDALYKDIHAHPEIAFQEEKTAAKLAAEMRALGFEVTVASISSRRSLAQFVKKWGLLCVTICSSP